MIRYVALTRGKVGPIVGAARVDVPVEIPCASTVMCAWAIDEAVRRYAEYQHCNVTQVHVFGSFGGTGCVPPKRTA